MGVVEMKRLGGILVTIALCGVVWLVHPAKEQVKQMEGQIGEQYLYANFLLRDTVEELLAWDFSHPLSDADEGYVNELSDELLYTSNLMFNGNVVHHGWRDRIKVIEHYLNDYVYGSSLSEENIADLHQALQATRFISMDFNSTVDGDYYDAMHDEQHEMVIKVKNRLATRY